MQPAGTGGTGWQAQGQPATNRWLVAGAAVVMQVGLGTVQAWSVFTIPLAETFGWTPSQLALTYAITHLTSFGFAAFLGGLWLGQAGPRPVALAAAVLYGLGIALASFAADRLWVLYLTHGLLAGLGRGLGYIVPVATLGKWFPEQRGLAAGIAVAGCGAGALLAAPLATRLIPAVGVLPTFALLGVAYLVAVVSAAWFMQDPPAGFRPPGWQPAAVPAAPRAGADATLRQALATRRWYGLWTLLFLNVTAGGAILSQAAPLARELAGVDAPLAASLVGIIALANAAGRFCWIWLAAVIGRQWVFPAMFLLQATVFAVLPLATTVLGFTLLAVLVLLCFGGGFAVLPTLVADSFGPRHLGSIYGLLLSACGFGGVVGALLVASIRELTGGYTPALYGIAALMLLSAGIALLVRPRQPTGEASSTACRVAEAV